MDPSGESSLANHNISRPDVEAVYVLYRHVTGKVRNEWRRDVMAPTDASWVFNGTRILLSPEPSVFAAEGTQLSAFNIRL